jgi:hypothetical protein
MDYLSRIRGRATYANVTSTLALFVALGGGSFAVASLSGSEKKVVTKIAKVQANKRITARAPGLTVKHARSAAAAPPTGAAAGDLIGTYPGPQLADGAVTFGKIAPGVVRGNEISDGAITGREFFAQQDVSLNFPSISAGTCSALTLQRQGGPDAHLLVTPPSHFADTFTLTGKLAPVSLGVIQYRFVACNVFGGGGAADPDGSGGGTYRALVILDGF